ncbi:DNA polymerase kappa isoform X2 [Brachyhypopomus gauderio]|uniref:DNA polymerase kappa isoform X2 n=1 Tax=Brachyhypopomus gauderio TaxID=698409 RepID=UPI0040434018
MEGEADGRESILSRMAINDNKAGMEGLDRDKINKIILESSKGSRFYVNELKKDQQVNKRIEKMMRWKAKLTEQQIQKAQAEVEKLSAELERGRELGRVIVHVDMDAFYAAVEMRDCPELKEKPMAVGSMSMLSTSNYHARRYGVRAGMPGFIAKKLCPDLVIVPLNFDKYTAVSEQVREVFAAYDPHFVPMSLDEAYLDITEHLHERQRWPESMRSFRFSDVQLGAEIHETKNDVRVDNLSPVLFEDSPSASPTLPGADGKVEVFGTSPEEAVREMRFRIEQKTSLTASAGIAPNMMLAKVCSDKNKPNGQYRILPERPAVMDFIRDLPVRKVSGIGKVTEKMLAALDIFTCSQLRQQMAVLSLLFSETTWHHFLQISLGLGSARVERDSERKSMSTERTFGEMSDPEEQYALCRTLCRDLARDLQKEGLKGKTVTLKLKNVIFEVKTRAFTLQCAVCTEEEIFTAAKELLTAEIDHVRPQLLKLRLMGVRVSSFINSDDKRPQQKSMVGFLKIAAGSRGTESRASSRPQVAGSSESGASSSLQQPADPQSAFVGGQTFESLNKLGTEPGDTRGPQQQTFFQMAHSKRLQEQAGQETSSAFTDGRSTAKRLATDSAHNLGFFATTCQEIDKTRNAWTSSSITCAESDRKALKADTSLPTTGAVSLVTQSTNKPSLAKTQSLCVAECFTCPVCLSKVQTTDLAAFNRHIDDCLESSATGGENPQTAPGQNALQEPKRTEGKDKEVQPVSRQPSGTDPCSGSKGSFESLNKGLFRGVEEEQRPTSSSAVTATFIFENGENSGSFSSMKEKRSLVPDPGTVALVQTSEVIKRSLEENCSTLTCPVCNQPQDTSDLIVFNHHVDMCLNQEVLLGFKDAVSPQAQIDGLFPQKSKDVKRASGTRGKSKRRGSTPPPPSKKTRPTGPRLTIDKFFKGNSDQRL